MYSMVLMVAMTASPEAAAFGGGCNGCGGGLFSGRSCHGGGLFGGKSCTGCTGSSCHGGLFNGGCHGGGLFGGKSCSGSSCHGGLFNGGCHGSSCSGSSCHGGLFSGLFHGKSCNGCSGNSCCGCTGVAVPAGCTGCTGGAATDKKDMPKPVDPKKGGGVTAAPAYIAVNVPAEATITIDGAPTKSTTANRIFSTPELTAGTVYYYTIVAEVVRDGKTYVATEKVAVEAGVTVQISLNPTVGEVASK